MLSDRQSSELIANKIIAGETREWGERLKQGPQANEGRMQNNMCSMESAETARKEFRNKIKTWSFAIKA